MRLSKMGAKHGIVFRNLELACISATLPLTICSSNLGSGTIRNRMQPQVQRPASSRIASAMFSICRGRGKFTLLTYLSNVSLPGLNDSNMATA
jgi:hypothetical protein